MKRLICLISMMLLVGLVAACGTDDASSGTGGDNNLIPDADVGPGADTTTPDANNGGEDTGDDGGSSGRVCESDDHCEAPEVCLVDRSGDEVDMTCQSPNPGGGELGDSCTDDSDCASNLCVDGQCSRPCQRPIDCSDDGSFVCEPTDLDLGGGGSEQANVCRENTASGCSSDSDCSAPDRCIATKGADELTFQCGSPNAGGSEVGESCVDDSDCAQNLCHEGVCSAPCTVDGDCSGDNFSCEIGTVDLGNGNTDNAQVCTPPTPCASDDECRVGEVCYVDRSSDAQPSYCRSGNNGGGGLGTICSADQGCEANLCHDGRFRDVCTVPCDDNSDCPQPGYECDTAGVANGSGGSFGMDICVASDPNPCTSNSDCASGTTCAIVPDDTNSALESVCVPSAGGKTTGVACTDDDECAGLVCMDGFCSVPCTDRSDCSSTQTCSNGTISKQGLSGDFDVCQSPGDERCDDTGTCSDGLRVCSDLRSDTNNNYEAYCEFPNSSAPATLGESCEQTSDCRERICLSGNSDECSVVCTQDSQCASQQLCTTLTLGNTDMGYCMRGCSRNQDCAALGFTDGSGNTVDHVCGVNQNMANGGYDQICYRRNIVDPNDSTAGLLGDTCADGSQCQTGLCLTNTVYDGRSCTSSSQCDPGQSCEATASGGSQCAEVASYCTRLCVGGGDCSGGVSGNPLTACDQNITVGGGADTISACATPN